MASLESLMTFLVVLDDSLGVFDNSHGVLDDDIDVL